MIAYVCDSFLWKGKEGVPLIKFFLSRLDQNEDCYGENCNFNRLAERVEIFEGDDIREIIEVFVECNCSHDEDAIKKTFEKKREFHHQLDSLCVIHPYCKIDIAAEEAFLSCIKEYGEKKHNIKDE